MSDINWDEAPEGATHLLEWNGEQEYSFFDGTYNYASKGDSDERVFYLVDGDYPWVIISERPSKPVTLSPVYTQIMADNGESPLVGMECMINDSSYDNKYYKSVISFVGTSNIVWTHGGTEYSQTKNLLNFNAITTPIELDNGKAYQFEARGKTLIGIYDTSNKTLNIHQGYYFDLISATNIQLLEVK